MHPTKEFVDSIFREKVLRARRQPPEEKFWDGAQLFDYACAIARIGIRQQFPNAGDEEVEAELSRRLRIAELLESRG